MTFLSTASGMDVSLTEPRPEQMPIITIAWGLSQINRFHGQAQRPYSVAEHSLLVAEIVEREYTTDTHAQLAALMHDAHEFVTQDVAGPVKQFIGPAWYAFEQQWQRRVQHAYCLLTPSAVWRDVIKTADLRARATERRDLMAHNAEALEWPDLIGVQPVDWVDLWAPERRQHDWEFWRDRFMDRYGELDYARANLMARIGRAVGSLEG